MAYKEIFRLKEMLEGAGIPFEWKEMNGTLLDGFQICYPSRDASLVCSVIEHKYSYGGPADKLEIMGLLTKEEKKQDGVLGWLDAEEVFGRIRKHWEAA